MLKRISNSLRKSKINPIVNFTSNNNTDFNKANKISYVNCKFISTPKEINDDNDDFSRIIQSLDKLVSYKENVSSSDKIDKIITEITKSKYAKKEDFSNKKKIYKFLLREISSSQIQSLFSVLINENPNLLENLSDMILSNDIHSAKINRNSFCLLIQNLINLKKFDKAYFYFVSSSLNGVKHNYLISNSIFLQISFEFKLNLLNKAKENLKNSKSKSISHDELNQMNAKMENDTKIHFLKRYMKRNYSNQDYKNSIEIYNKLKGKNLDQIYKNEDKQQSDVLFSIEEDDGKNGCKPV